MVPIVSTHFAFLRDKLNVLLPPPPLSLQGRIKEIMDSNDVNAQTKAAASPICDSTSVNQTYLDSKG